MEKGGIVEAGGQTMNITYGAVAYPPLHPCCACNLLPILNEKYLRVPYQELKEELSKITELLPAPRLG